MTTESCPFHPLDPEHFANPYPHLQKARAQGAVTPTPSPQPGTEWFFCSTDDVSRQALGSKTLSNAGNFQLDTKYPPVITQLDGDDHARLRSILEQSFNASVFKDTESVIQQYALERVQEMLQAGERRADIMERIARKLPPLTLAHLVGLPLTDAPLLQEWNAVINRIIPGDFYSSQAWQQFEGYIRGVIAGYRMAKEAPDTIISRLLKTSMKPDEIFMTIFQLLVAGADTTMLLMGSLLLELLSVPERWEAVKENPKLIPGAIEETLRIHPPLNWVMRSCPVATDLGGDTLPAGSHLVIGLHSANRDERRWGEQSEVFEMTRKGNANHLAFGYGAHFCLGAPLARLQARILLETLIEHVPSLQLATEEQAYVPIVAPMIHGPASLIVCW